MVDEIEPDCQTQVRIAIATQLLHREVSKLTGSPLPHSPASTESGDYSYADAGGLAEVQKQWEDHLEELRADSTRIDDAERLATAPLAADPSSGHYIRRIQAALQSLRDHNHAMLRYTENYIEKLAAARGLTVGTDEDAAHGLRGGA